MNTEGAEALQQNNLQFCAINAPYKMCQNSASLCRVCSGDSALWLGKREDSGGSVPRAELEENIS